jgi:exosortase A-associated hydrolase 2
VSRGSLSGHFLGDPGRRAFVLLREPAAAAPGGGSVLVVPPFGEEMNKSRRMIAETSQRLCEAGVTVVLPDLFGTGDSEGEFRDATLERWIDDLSSACRLAESRGRPVQAVLAVRLGSALAAAAARAGAVPAVTTSVWWQPVVDGKRHLAQFLRLRVAAGSMRGDDPETVEGLRGRSAAGETIAVAGYELSPALVSGLEALATDGLPPQVGALHWIEFVREAERYRRCRRPGSWTVPARPVQAQRSRPLQRNRSGTRPRSSECRRRSSRPRPYWPGCRARADNPRPRGV